MKGSWFFARIISMILTCWLLYGAESLAQPACPVSSLTQQLQAVGVPVAAAVGVEGCRDLRWDIHRTGDLSQPATLALQVGGTAQLGLDLPLLPPQVTFAVGEDSLSFTWAITADGQPEGAESLQLMLSYAGCGALLQDTVNGWLQDPPAVQAGPDTAVCQGETLQIGAGATFPGLTYQWQPAQELDAPSTHRPYLQSQSPGWHLLRVEAQDSLGCTAQDTLLVQVHAMSLALQLQDPQCAASGTGDAQVDITGHPPYTITWYDDQQQVISHVSQPTPVASLSGLNEGDYAIEVRTWHGCQQEINFTLGHDSLQVVPALLSSSCQPENGEIAVATRGGLSPYEFSLDGVNWTFDSLFTALPSGTYPLQVRDQAGCGWDSAVVVPAGQVLHWHQVQNQAASCEGKADGQLILAGRGGTLPYSYALDNQGFQGSAGYTSLAAGSYLARLRDARGCELDTLLVVDAPDLLSLVVDSAGTPTCVGGTDGWVQLQGFGGSRPFAFSRPPTPAQADSLFTGLAAGPQVFWLEDAQGCGDSVAVDLEAPEPVTLTLQSQQAPTCAGQQNGSLLLSATGPASPFRFAHNGGAWQPDSLFTGLGAGAQVLVAENTLGCRDTLLVTLTAPAPLHLPQVTWVPPACAGGDGELTLFPAGGNGGWEVSWAGGPYLPQTHFSALAAGSYPLQIRDSLGCELDTLLQLDEPSPIYLEPYDWQPPACAGGATGTLGLSVRGGHSPYRYRLMGQAWQDSGYWSSLRADSLWLEVEDQAGCRWDTLLGVNTPAPLRLRLVELREVSCQGGNDGAIEVQAQGGQAPYRYRLDNLTWGPGGAFAGLSPGSYLLSLRDTAGCRFDTTLVVGEPDSLELHLEALDSISCAGAADGRLHLRGMGGRPPYEYALTGQTWQGPGVFEGLGPGSYQVLLRDVAGCEEQAGPWTLLEPVPLQASAELRPSCAGEATGEIRWRVSGGRLPYHFSWEDDPQWTAPWRLDLDGGAYAMRITDGRGCQLDTVALVESLDPIVITLIDQGDAYCRKDNGWLTVVARGGIGGPYLYHWDGQTGSASRRVGLAPGSYEVVVADYHGCEAQETYEVEEEPAPVAQFTLDPAGPVLHGLPAVVQFSNQSEHAVRYEWQFGDGQMAADLEPGHAYQVAGEYEISLIAWDIWGSCSDTAIYQLTVVPTLAVWLPTAFSPNGDGHNDTWAVQGPAIERWQVRIFNRWGQEVRFLQQEPWDGRGQTGTPLATGVYVFELQAEMLDGTSYRRGGTLHLLR